MLTGEPVPVEKVAGARVTGRTQNGTGSFDMRVDRTGVETTLAQVVEMVATAQRSRAPIQALADTVSGYFVPAVILVAITAFFAWLFFGPAPTLAYALVATVNPAQQAARRRGPPEPRLVAFRVRLADCVLPQSAFLVIGISAIHNSVQESADILKKNPLLTSALKL
jgi:hypothetical protein